MSNVDQAFIKAYGRGAAAAPAAAAETAASSATAPVAERTTAPADPNPRHFIDDAHAEVPAPHGRHPTDWLRPPEVLAQRQRQIHAEPPGEPLRAAFEVEQFTWPRLIEILIAAAGTEFGYLADELISRSRNDRRLLAISGLERGEGRTTLLLALARVLSGRGIRVALVDADFHHPHLAAQLRIAPQVGWEDVLADRETLAEALVESTTDRLTLLPLRGLQAGDSAVAHPERVAQSLTALARQYEIVLIDAGPLTDDAAAVDLAAVLHGCEPVDALVARDVRSTQPADVRRLERRLIAGRIARWDLVETFVRLPAY